MQRRPAMSLIEVVIAMVILALAVVPISVQLRAGVDSYGQARVQTDLVELARERLCAIYLDHANPLRGYAAITAAAYPSENNAGGMSGYTRATTVKEVDPQDFKTAKAGSGVKRVKISVVGPNQKTLSIEAVVCDVPGAGEQSNSNNGNGNGGGNGNGNGNNGNGNGNGGGNGSNGGGNGNGNNGNGNGNGGGNGSNGNGNGNGNGNP